MESPYFSRTNTQDHYCDELTLSAPTPKMVKYPHAIRQLLWVCLTILRGWAPNSLNLRGGVGGNLTPLLSIFAQ